MFTFTCLILIGHAASQHHQQAAAAGAALMHAAHQAAAAAAAAGAGNVGGQPLAAVFPWAHGPRGKPRRGMMRRAVFSDLQRKGLERRFQLQKYISKPDRKKLADKLGLKDSQVIFLSFL